MSACFVPHRPRPATTDAPPLPITAMLAGFASGATLLQFCARLPPAPGALTLATLGVVCTLVAAAFRHASLRQNAARRIDDAAPSRVDAMALTTGAAAALAAAALGFCYAAWRAEVRLADALPGTWEDVDLRIVGVVDDLPQNDPSGARFAFAVERVLTRGAVVPSRVSLAWHAPRSARDEPGTATPAVHAGERWNLLVRLKRPHGNVNPHGFDLEAWLLEHGLRATGYVRDDATNARTTAFAGRPGDYVQRARERIRERIAAALPGARYAGVLVALAIGDQRAIPEPQWSVFGKTGITHLVSISGLHVTVFAALAGGVAFAFARRCAALTLRMPARKIASLVGAIVAFGYVLLAGAEVPAVRTLLMLVVAALGLWLARPGTASLVWLWSLVAVLAWDPWAGLAPGFWLSFGAVGLLLYAGSNRLRAPPSRGARGRWSESLRAALHAQYVVTIGLVPGTLAIFQQVSVVSALANAIAIPVVTLGVVPLALLGIVVPLDLPWIVAHAILALLMRYLEWLAALPLAAWSSHAPRGWTVALAVAGILWLLAPRGVPGRLLGGVWTLPMALLLPPAVPEGGLRLVVLDVGQGLAVFVATARHVLLYDAGPRFNDAVDAGGRIVVPFLRAAGVSHLDALVVSHADSDHSGGALSIMHALRVDGLVSSLPPGHPILATNARAPPATRCSAGTRWHWDGVEFEFLHPASSAYADAARRSNDLSCVLRIVSAGGSVLLTGDIEAPSEGEMLVRRAALSADVLVVPHHGSRTSSTPAFVAAVAPRFALIAAGYRNRFGHPRGEILARYAQSGAARLRTDLGGAISVRLVPGAEINVGLQRERARRYWYDPAT